MKKKKSSEPSYQDLMKESSITRSDRIVAARDYIMPFGKYRGCFLAHIIEHEIQYLSWLEGLGNLKDPLRSHVKLLCDEYKDEISEAIDGFDEHEGYDGDWR